MSERIVVNEGDLAAPGIWISEAPHLTRALLHPRVRLPGVRSGQLTSVIRVLTAASWRVRVETWARIRHGLEGYDSATLRAEALRVGLLKTVEGDMPFAGEDLDRATQLTFDELVPR